MTGIMHHPVLVEARLQCSSPSCDAEATSPTYPPRSEHEDVIALQNAWRDGWRVYQTNNEQRSYCPRHEPTNPEAALLLHGEEQFS